MSEPSTATEPVVVREQHGHVLVLRLNRPEARNALNSEMIAALGVAIRDAEEGDDIRAIVITGTGDRAFCSGMDLRAFSEGDTPAPDPDAEATSGNFMRLMRGGVTVPVIAAVQASAVAGGFEIVMGCDLVVASEDARFGLPEVKRALFPGGDGILLATRIPLPIAMEITLTGDYIDAERAYDLGLVNRVVPAERVLDEALALAERIVANSPAAVAGVRELVHGAAAGDLDAAWALNRRIMREVAASPDGVEGARAFVEKRAPVWTDPTP